MPGPAQQPSSIANRVFSHRGTAAEEVEHTFAAYDLAIAYGSRNIELDVVSSADQTLFVSHDETAERIAGVSRSYSDMTDDEILRLRAIGNGEPIHTVEEIFDRYGAEVDYVIELRSSEQVSTLANLLAKRSLQNNVIVQAKTIDILLAVHASMPKARTLLIVHDGNFAEVYEKGLESNAVDIIALEQVFLTPQRVEEIHVAGKLANAWTVNSIMEIRNAIDAGVDSYFTDYTAKAFVIESEVL